MEIVTGLKHLFTIDRSQKVTPPEQKPTPPTVFERREPYFRISHEHNYQFTSNDLIITVPAESRRPIFVQDKQLVAIPEGSTLAQIDFSPNGFIGKKPDNSTELTFTERTAVLAQFLVGFNDYFAFLQEHPTLTKPLYLYGDTNERMAQTMQKFGFKISEDPIPHKKRVYGENSEIKAKVDGFFASKDGKESLADKIIKRASLPSGE